MSQLNDDDYITSTHVVMGVAKGCDLNGMMAEIMGKRGLGHGKGGSMHVAKLTKECSVRMVLSVVVLG